MPDAPEREAQPEPEALADALPPPTRPSAWRGMSTPLQRLSLRHALVLLALWIAINTLGLLPGIGETLGRPPVPQVVAALFLLCAIGLYRWSDVGLVPPLKGTLRLLWLPLLYLPVFLLVALVGGTPHPQIFSVLMALMLWVAVSEELMFRGLLYPALRTRLSIWPSIWLATLLFAAVHLGNGIRSGAHGAAMLQSLAAVSTGLVLMAMRLRSGSLWPPILYHMAWNVCVFAVGVATTEGTPGTELPQPGEVPMTWQSVAFSLMLVLPNGLYGLWLLRHAGKRPLPGDAPPERHEAPDSQP